MPICIHKCIQLAKVPESVSIRVTIEVKLYIFAEAAIFSCFNDFGVLWIPSLFTAVCTMPFINTSADYLIQIIMSHDMQAWQSLCKCSLCFQSLHNPAERIERTKK